MNAAVKLQYRELDTFIHPDFAGRADVQHVSRFESTRLDDGQLRMLVDGVKSAEMRVVVTPFDEASVGCAIDHGAAILKVASCSAMDWPLLETIADARLPVIVSTGGLSIDDIDRIVSFFTHRGTEFALMHCVAIYPTPNAQLNLNFVGKLRRRYPHVQVGYSGHEHPDNTDVGQLAISKGAELLERHVGLPTDEITLNKYSMSPEQTQLWVQSVLRAKEICGDDDKKHVGQAEIDSLRSLMRGVWAARGLKRGESLSPEDVFFAMPVEDGQLTSGEFGTKRANFTASRDYEANEPIFERCQPDEINMIRSILHDAKGMLFETGVVIGDDHQIELSHHYGIEHFRSVGAVIISLINREYCKKLIILLQGQRHPPHTHTRKEETFRVLWGDLEVTRKEDEDDEAERVSLKAGDMLLVGRNVQHSFRTSKGVVFEEISTTHYRDDSLYEDTKIANLDPMQRKTILDSW